MTQVIRRYESDERSRVAPTEALAFAGWRASSTGASMRLAAFLLAGVPVMFMPILLQEGAPMWAWALAALIALGLGSFACIPSPKMRVFLGEDGFSLRDRGREQFIAYEQIGAIHERSAERVIWIDVHLVEGRLLHIRLADPLPQRKAFLARLRELSQQSQEPREQRALERELGRGDRSMREWLDALEKRTANDYRGPALDRGQLLELVGDGRAEPSARTAAAWLLRRSADVKSERARIAEAAASTADPRVRVVLEAAADDAQAELDARMASEERSLRLS